MINRTELLKNLQGLLPHIEKDILAYSEENQDLNQHLKEEYQAALEAERTAEHFVAWREAQITQAAVAWVLTCVFVRFLEDNGLLAEPVLAGPVKNAKGENALQQAKERMVAYFNEHPTHEERHYLLDLFDELERFPVIAELLDHRHNPLWLIPVSADGAKRLIDFFQRLNPGTGDIQHDFTDTDWDTRFLGDLYQDLSESVRKRYALLQTPEFVESFILDYTLEPAISEFGLPGLRLIDPTCGSGHFLLTTFERVFERWLKREPGINTRVLAQRALDVVHGTDINPYAIAICRFRLLIAAMKAAGADKINQAPDFHFNLACGDSLLHGRRFEWEGQGIQTELLEVEKQHAYEVEDQKRLNEILGQRYHVVVGNPPYITVSDKALNQAYRDKYPTCYRKYSLGAPFTERFFDLTLWPEGNKSAGYLGMITANSFMKREFGKKLIEDYLPRKDLTHVIDTSVAYIPGHGTPTVIIFARNQAPNPGAIRAVMGIRGESAVPDVPAQGRAWTSIVSMTPKAGSENEYISVSDKERSIFSKHPWSISGGGASELKDLIERGRERLLSRIDINGFGAILGEDEAFAVPSNKLSSCRFPKKYRLLVEGDQVRDWSLNASKAVFFPYDSEILFSISREQERYAWPLRTILWARNTFGKKTYKASGRHFAEYHQIPRERNKTSLCITFAHVATHNHFVLARGGKIFNRSAPIITLPKGSSEADHFPLLGLLNSSTGCFWMKQVFYPKGGDHVGSEGARVRKTLWDERYDHAGTGLMEFPIPNDSSLKASTFAKRLDSLAMRLKEVSPKAVVENENKLMTEGLERAKKEEADIWSKMISLQEELDWHVYFLYNLTDEPVCYDGEVPEVQLGERAFEILLARKLASGEVESTWFDRHGSIPTVELPSHWPDDYRALVQRRLRIMEENRSLKLIEQPEYKRRWNRDSWEDRLKSEAKEWLLNRLVRNSQSVELQTCAQLADRMRKEAIFLRVAEVYCDSDLVDLQALVCELVDGESVPQMAAARLKSTSMPKFRAWQEVWGKQREEDAIDAKYGVDEDLPAKDREDSDKRASYDLAREAAAREKERQVGEIPAPPQYKQADFLKVSYWRLRGKLDVQKERFFSLPGCEKDGDGTLVIGWAGLDHLQRATAIASWYLERKESEGWSANRLIPILVALDELIPWLKQWHNEIDPEFGERMGDYYEAFLMEELRLLDIPHSSLFEWAPPAVASRRSGRKKKSPM
ncbi:BREX-2 system adenine-specific DNA-methyltransferase PglX [Microbulbifer salipaludis]|uniref:site-specific DNA-methyltransferase (adenine-specific) n=1 Tax=Microbulbifer salipaludis TaxID=187980 RepID=A0ABS3E835_9GAMM|nr:BREX-2 system adenine-specific DNA-methyltransferase PglX [Microbulbifer salipaludis]MBN8431454.1 BREX-2 system adenine-specific DNA-methyltransferase PglX [Microbulbifer salipaludis]